MSDNKTEIEKIIDEEIAANRERTRTIVRNLLDNEIRKVVMRKFGLHKNWSTWELEDGSPADELVGELIADLKGRLMHDASITQIKDEVFTRCTRPKPLKKLRKWIQSEVQRTLREEIMDEWRSNTFKRTIEDSVSMAVSGLLKASKEET